MDKHQLHEDFQSIKRLKVITSRKTFSARRIICDHVNAVGGIFNVDVANKQLQVSAAGARQKYLVQLEDQKKQKTQQASRKRKLVSDEVEQLKKQKLCISNDIEAMRKAADDYADKAEKLHDLTYIAKSNSLRWVAKDKDAELKSISWRQLVYNSRTVKLGRCLLLY